MRKHSKNPTAQCKERIQALLRELAIKIYGTCVLSKYPETGECGGYRKDGELILQAEHLVSRARSVSYGDMRNIVLLCLRHHGYWKNQNSRLYWEIIKEVIGAKRWAWIKRVEANHKAYPMGLHEWTKIEMSLKQEIKKYEKT